MPDLTKRKVTRAFGTLVTALFAQWVQFLVEDNRNQSEGGNSESEGGNAESEGGKCFYENSAH
jgi:hypothetical protein